MAPGPVGASPRSSTPALVGAVALAATALAAAAARASLLVVVVDGDSMRPTYANGDRLLVLTRGPGRTPRRGDVVVVRGPDPTWTAQQSLDHAHVQLVKRVTAVAGEGNPYGSGPVPTGRVYVAGDSPGYDSGVFGPLPLAAVVGRVLLRLGTATHFDEPSVPGVGHPS